MSTTSRRLARAATIALFAAGVFLVSDPVRGAGGAWVPRASMPTARFGPAAAVLDEKLYVVGGDDGASTGVATLEVYDPATDSWCTKGSMPTARLGLSFVEAGGLLYAIGGDVGNGNATDVVEAYDPAADAWSTKTAMPTARHFPMAAKVGGKIYVCGGTAGVDQISTVEAYDPATDTWSTKASMPTVRYAGEAAEIGGTLYLVGGLAHWPNLNLATEVYDPTTNTWRAGTSLPSARDGFASGVIGGTLYVVGGANSGGVLDSMVAFAIPPAAPSSLAASANSGQEIALSWTDNSDNEAGFEVQRKTGDGAFSTITTTGPAVTSYTDVGRSECTTYAYQVRAVNIAGTSGFSNEASATTADTTPPVLTAPATVTLVTDCAGSALSITPANLGVSAKDDCDPAPAVACSPTSVSPGTTSVDCTATDAAGNVAHASVSVTVFRGPFLCKFLSPLDDSVDNLIKAGQTVPVKVSVYCGSNFESAATVTVNQVDKIDSSGTTVANTVPEDSGLSNDGGNVFRLADGSYIYNLSTKGWASTSGARFRVRVRVQETGHVDTFADVVLKNR